MNTRFPAFPLITCDPYFNVWSMSDKLNDDFPRHWTGMQNPLTGIIKIDDKEKVFMGKKRHNPFYNKFFGTPEKIEQTSVEVTPLKTIYIFNIYISFIITNSIKKVNTFKIGRG